MVELVFSAANIVLSAIMVGIFGVWVYFLAYMIKSFRQSPRIESIPDVDGGNISAGGGGGRSNNGSPAKKTPKVSVILPARNEERYISRCLDSLLAQDYPDFEVIAINDSSTDKTGEIMERYAARDRRVVCVSAPPKPEGWAGKNWACYEGYLRANGDLLLFTDADTVHSPSAMSLAVRHLEAQGLDALSAMPKLVCNDFWTKVTLPALSTFLHTRFSALRVNDPKTKTGYFFGSFYVITREAYEAVGTHKGVRRELVEDGALGGKVKASGFKMRMVRGEQQVEAIWARDLPTLWQGLRRLMIPLYYQDRAGAQMMAAAVFFILFEPFVVLPYSAFASAAGAGFGASAQVLLGLNLATVAIMFAATAVQCRLGVFESPAYALAAPISGAMVSFGFISAIADAKKEGAVSWRDRQYTVSEAQGQRPVH